ncbi:hypothetical protein [Haladaptatus sp. DYSN1]|uniref:hypothetical protein n=1 Tax=unclassified Haladaptatus TaxID=2622732 RepID=UPI002406EA69|nr:hypothetical protein [Haladaptatus sp. DYSN1]
MSVGQRNDGVLAGIRVDLKRLHETWMELVFPRQLDTEHTVLGKWRPNNTLGKVSYRLWGALGAPLVAIFYPLALFGYMTRFYTRKIDGTATRLGVLGVLLLSLVVWGALTALARMRFSADGFIAVAAASVVATVAAVLAVLSSRAGGRGTTVLLAYPFGMTALFLPPVVAALYSPTLADAIFPQSTTLAKWILDNLLTVGDLNTYIRTKYDLEGVAYVGMWFGIAVPLGWLLGILVTIADLLRPK